MNQPLTIFYFSAIQLGIPDAGNNHTLEICRQLAEHGHSIYLFVPKPLNEYSQPEKIQLVITPAIGKMDTFLRTFSFYLFLPLAAWKYFSRLHPDILYTRFSFLEFLAVLPLRTRFKVVHVAEINGIRSLESRGGKFQRSLVSRLERLSLSLCDAVITVTIELEKWISLTTGLQKDRIAVIGNGVNVERFTPKQRDLACRSLGLDPDGIYLNFTGSLKSWHGTRTVIGALPAIIKGYQMPVQLLILGDGPEKAGLQAYSQQLGVENSIRWVGRIPNESVPDYINASTICLAPITADENTSVGRSSLKIFEYMSCARPVVTTLIGAAYDDLVTEGGFGLLVPPNDPEAMAEAVLELLNDPEKARDMGDRGRKAVLEHYSWKKRAGQTDLFLRQQLTPKEQ
jgi:glycosyltransferase involved in cell wall biosynthesis